MVISESKNEDFCTEVSDGNTTITSDVTKEKGGQGEGFRPHDMLCAAFASCLNITTRMILNKRNINYDKIIVKVDLDRSEENKTKFIYDVDIVGDISTELKEKVMDMLKRCPVRKTLSKEIEFYEG